MTGEQDTGNPARWPVAERARRGLLAGEPVLTLEDILALEFPGADYKTTKPWRRRIETAIEFGMLEARRFNPFPYEPGDVVFIFGCSTWLIDRDDYRTWRAAQSDPPEDSFIRFWLDDPDQGEPRQSEAGELAPPPQGEPAHVLSDRDIKTLRDAGQSVDAIHEQYGIPRDRIKRVNKRFGIHPLSRGPKPKTSD